MKKRIITLALTSTALALSVGAFALNKQAEKTSAIYSPSTTYEVSDTASELESYYSSVGSGDTGDTLLSRLRSINSSKYHKNFSYSNFGTSSSTSPYVYTDYPLGTTTTDSNGQIRGSSIASFYTKTTANSFNKEHVWPNSKGGNKVENDILMPRPTISSENSSRGNSNFVEGMNSSSGGWDPYTAGYDKECRGECARIMLYCVVASSQLSLVASNSGGDTSCGNMNTLIKWHFDYAPSVYEMNRNNGAEYLQGNRNPFVDHPEYVAKIWSNFNSTVSDLCTNNASKYSDWTPGNYCDYGSNTPVNPNTGVTISNTTANITVGSTTTLSATATNNGTISWTTSNSSIARLSSSSSASGANITITGVSAGTATITAKATIDGTQYSKTCIVIVSKVVSSLSKGNTSPTKTVYTAGESFDPTGLTITATYSDSTTANVTSSVVWTPDPLTVGTTSVTGTYGGKSITISGLTVNAATEPEIIDSNSDLSVGDYVVIRTAAGVGVTGWNNNKDATVSETQSEWKKYYVASASSSGFTLKDEAADDYIASPGSSNQFVYGDAATCSTDASGHLICNRRYLCKNGTNYRFYTSISSYLPFFIYKMPASSSTKTLSSISVSTAPNKTTYTAGEYFDPTGLVITRTYSDNSSDTYTYANHSSEFEFDPDLDEALTTSDTSVTITYGDKTTTQSITVNPASKTLSSISVGTAPSKITYQEGEYFDPTGLVITRYYSDNSSDTYSYANHASEFSFDPDLDEELSTYDNSVTITYGGKTTTQSITVNAIPVTLESISVQTAPSKTSYEVGETFDPTGLVITRNYSNGTSDTYSYAGHSSEFSFDPDLDEELTTSDTIVTITYGGQSTTQAITVTSSGGQQENEYSLTSGSPYINGVAYKMYFYSTNKSKKYYFTGSLTGSNNQYGTTSDTLDSSVVDVYFEESGSGQNIYFIKNNTTYYLQIVKTTSGTKTYYNFGYSTTRSSIKWMYSDEYNCLTFSMDEHIYSFGNYSSYTNFSGYDIEAHSDNYKLEFVTSSSEGAVAFATVMNDNIKCVSSGASEPSLSGYAWEFFSSVYSSLDDSSKEALQSQNPTDAEIFEFVERYDYIVGKYGTGKYRDFLNRSPEPVGNGAYNFSDATLNDNNIILILSIVSIATMSLAVLLVIKKKKRR